MDSKLLISNRDKIYKRLCIISILLIAFTYGTEYILESDASRGEFIENQYLQHYVILSMLRVVSILILLIGLIGILIIKLRANK